jgi:hypothetical protein
MTKHLISVDDCSLGDRPPRYILVGSMVLVIGCQWIERDIDLDGWDVNILSGHDRESFTMICQFDRLRVKELDDTDVLFRDVTLGSFISPLTTTV